MLSLRSTEFMKAAKCCDHQTWRNDCISAVSVECTSAVWVDSRSVITWNKRQTRVGSSPDQLSSYIQQSSGKCTSLAYTHIHTVDQTIIQWMCQFKDILVHSQLTSCSSLLCFAIWFSSSCSCLASSSSWLSISWWWPSANRCASSSSGSITPVG